VKGTGIRQTIVSGRFARDYVNLPISGQACFVKFFTSWEEPPNLADLAGIASGFRFLAKFRRLG